MEQTRQYWKKLRSCDPASHFALSEAERARIEAYVVTHGQALAEMLVQRAMLEREERSDRLQVSLVSSRSSVGAASRFRLA